MRASDTERQRAVEELRRHCAAGRLDVDEYATRVERAVTASSVEELDQLLSDLPMLRIAEPASLRSKRDLTAFGAGRGPDRPGRLLETRLVATLIVVLSVLLVVGAIVITLTGFWTWALVLAVGWLVGLAQGRLRKR
jgi:hypothetical protein